MVATADTAPGITRRLLTAGALTLSELMCGQPPLEGYQGGDFTMDAGRWFHILTVLGKKEFLY